MSTDEPNNNPMAIENYMSMAASDIRSSGFTLQQLIVRQLDRIHYLLTLATAKTPAGQQYFSEETMMKSVIRGMRSIESLMFPYLKEDKEYQSFSREVKKQLAYTNSNKEDLVAQWEDQLISRLGEIDMLPQVSREIEFD